MKVGEDGLYGSIELKRSYNRNLAQGFLLSVLLHVALVGACLVTIGTIAGPGPRMSPLLPRIPWEIIPDKPRAEVSKTDHPSVSGDVAREPGSVIPTPKMAASIGSLPMPVLDDLVDDSLSVVDMAVALLPSGRDADGPFGNNGTGKYGKSWGDTSGRGLPSRSASAIPSEPVFIPHEVEPTFDQTELRRRVKYPDIARRNGLEGTVVLNVFVGKDGLPLKTSIEYCSNKVFESAAVGAVLETRFTPAEQNGESIGVWIMLPITFSLR